VPLANPNHHLDKNEKTPRFPENTEEQAGFSGKRLRSELNRRWRICNPQETNENIGNPDGDQHLVQHSKLTVSKNTANPDSQINLLSIAKESLEASRQAVQKLLDSIPMDDHYSLGILGPILGALRDAEREIEFI